MPQKNEYENYIKFVSEALLLAKRIPRYFSKYSNRIYCNHQKLVIYVLMQKLKLTTRGVVSFLRSNPSLCMEFGLLRIPVHTTIVRFVSKIKNIIGLLLGIRQAASVAVDATGFELESKSFYYRNIDKQLFPGFMRKTKTNMKFVINKLRAIPIIPARCHTNFYGYLRGKMKIDGKNYHQRSKVETVFSVIKRKYGSVLRCRSNSTQRVELISKLIAYNLDRKLNYFLLIRGLHQSLKISNYLAF